MGRACKTHGEKRNVCMVFMGKLEGKSQGSYTVPRDSEPRMAVLAKTRSNIPASQKGRAREELLASHRAPPQVADRGRLARYGGYPGRSKTSHCCLVVYEDGPSEARGRKP
jgi:hypothetical protein